MKLFDGFKEYVEFSFELLIYFWQIVLVSAPLLIVILGIAILCQWATTG